MQHFDQVGTYLWVIVISMFGGAVRILQKASASPGIKLFEIFVELVISVFSGLVTFWLSEASGISGYLQAALIAIAGHMGGSCVGFLENAILALWVRR